MFIIFIIIVKRKSESELSGVVLAMCSLFWYKLFLKEKFSLKLSGVALPCVHSSYYYFQTKKWKWIIRCGLGRVFITAITGVHQRAATLLATTLSPSTFPNLSPELLPHFNFVHLMQIVSWPFCLHVWSKQKRLPVWTIWIHCPQNDWNNAGGVVSRSVGLHRGERIICHTSD